MIKHIFIFLIAILLGLSALAQTDSATFVNAKWETTPIAKGVIWKHYWFNKAIFDTTENINIIEIKPGKKAKLALGYEKQIVKPVSEYAREAHAFAAINGGFFDVKAGGAVDVVKAKGNFLSVNKLDKTGQRAAHQKGALVFNNGTITIAKWDGSADWESRLTGDVLDAGPVLMYDKNAEELDTTLFVKKRHPRTAVAVTHNRILLITIDGRNANSAGVNLYELTKIVKWLNASYAINLDGGGSTTMYIDKQLPNGIVNYPCDNKKWDHDGARKVANVILIE